jgi:hypothetical protein
MIRYYHVRDFLEVLLCKNLCPIYIATGISVRTSYFDSKGTGNREQGIDNRKIS